MNASALVLLGGVFLLGLAAEAVGRHSRLPRVTLLLFLGIAIGPQGLGLIPPSWIDQFELVAALALTMVGFLLGGKLAGLTRSRAGLALRHSLVITLVSFVVVALGLYSLGFSPLLACLLGSVALATDPAA